MLLMICQSCVISAILIKSYSMPYGSPAVRINYYLLFHIQRMSKVPQFIHYFGAQSNESSQFCLAPNMFLCSPVCSSTYQVPGGKANCF